MRKSLEEYFSLKGRVAAVTGGGGELCGCMAEALGALGVRVAVLDLSLEKASARVEAIRKEGGTAEAFACNVLEEASLREVYAKVCALWDSPDFLINGAGGNDPRATTDGEFLERAQVAGAGPGLEPAERAQIRSFLDLELVGFRSTFELNFLGTSLPTKVFAGGMVGKGKGSILNMSSMNAVTPLTKIPAYSAAKAAVANFTRWLAAHFAHTGVRVNALLPGFFMTEQLRFLHIDQKTGEYTSRAKKVVAQTPMGRYGEPEELLGAVIWLLSDASSFVTGALIPIDGGFSSYSI